MKYIFVLLYLFTFTALFSQSDITAERGSKTADGNLDDWTLPLKYYDTEAHLQYAIANDDSMLYLSFRITEPEYQMKIIKGGMTVYFDITGKKKENVYIDCPMDDVIKEMSRNEEDMQDVSFPDTKGDLMQKKLHNDIQMAFMQFFTTGFRNSGVYSNKESDDVKVFANSTPDALNIEYAIKVSSFYKPLQTIDFTKKISLTFVIHGIEKPEMPPKRQNDDMYDNNMGTQPVNNMNSSHSRMGRMAGGSQPEFDKREPRGKQAMFQTTKTRIKLIFTK